MGFRWWGGGVQSGLISTHSAAPLPRTPYFKLLFPLFTLHGTISLLTPDE